MAYDRSIDDFKEITGQLLDNASSLNCDFINNEFYYAMNAYIKCCYAENCLLYNDKLTNFIKNMDSSCNYFQQRYEEKYKISEGEIRNRTQEENTEAIDLFHNHRILKELIERLQQEYREQNGPDFEYMTKLKENSNVAREELIIKCIEMLKNNPIYSFITKFPERYNTIDFADAKINLDAVDFVFNYQQDPEFKELIDEYIERSKPLYDRLEKINQCKTYINYLSVLNDSSNFHAFRSFCMIKLKQKTLIDLCAKRDQIEKNLVVYRENRILNFKKINDGNEELGKINNAIDGKKAELKSYGNINELTIKIQELGLVPVFEEYLRELKSPKTDNDMSPEYRVVEALKKNNPNHCDFIQSYIDNAMDDLKKYENNYEEINSVLQKKYRDIPYLAENNYADLIVVSNLAKDGKMEMINNTPIISIIYALKLLSYNNLEDYKTEDLNKIAALFNVSDFELKYYINMADNIVTNLINSISEEWDSKRVAI